jgi:signal transduction histidine kinase
MSLKEIRLRCCQIFAIIFAASCLAWSAFFSYLNQQFAAEAAFLCFAVALCMAYVSRRIRDTSKPTHILCVAVTLTTLACASTTGGWRSPLLFFLSVVPLLSTLLTDWPGGIFWVTVDLAVLSGFYAPELSASSEQAEQIVLRWLLASSLAVTVFALACIYQYLLKHQISEYECQAKKLQTTVKDKDFFVAQVSHEIRTPVQGILGLIDCLSEETSHARLASVDAIISQLRACCDILLRLVNNLLDLSAMQAGHVVRKESRSSIRVLVGSCFQLMNALVASKKSPVICHLEVDQKVPDCVLMDEPRVSQIVVNLTSNAVKYCPEGHLYFRVLLANQGKTIRFEVQDEGPGIPASFRERLWLPYESLNPSAGSSGLGLALAKQLAEIVGGKLGVSHLNRGTLFFLELAIKSGDSAMPGAGSAEPA